MIALIQRVSEARVEVAGKMVGAIDNGVLALVAVEPADGPAQTERMAERLAGYRIFPDEAGRMNRSLRDVGGGLLLVSQFTLAADTRKGMRPSLSEAADPVRARQMFEALVAACRRRLSRVETGVFGAHMRVSLVNDGPVTFMLNVT